MSELSEPVRMGAFVFTVNAEFVAVDDRAVLPCPSARSSRARWRRSTAAIPLRGRRRCPCAAELGLDDRLDEMNLRSNERRELGAAPEIGIELRADVPRARRLYAWLGVTSSASPAEIAQAFRRLAFELHPDRTSGDETAMKEINAALEILTKRRAEYDVARTRYVREQPTSTSTPPRSRQRAAARSKTSARRPKKARPVRAPQTETTPDTAATSPFPTIDPLFDSMFAEFQERVEREYRPMADRGERGRAVFGLILDGLNTFMRWRMAQAGQPAWDAPE